jgi:addiction module HigA family antidote
MLITNPAIHPGEILWEEFMQPLGLTAGRLARALGVPRTRIERLIAGKTALAVDSALRLGRYFGTEAGFWLNLMVSYDASCAQNDPALTRAVAAITPLAEQGVRGRAA